MESVNIQYPIGGTLELELSGIQIVSGKNGVGKTYLCEEVLRQIRSDSPNGYLYCQNNRLVLNQWPNCPQQTVIPESLQEAVSNPLLVKKQLFFILEGFLRDGGAGEGTILLLDDPDLGLHPDGQVLLAEILMEIVAKTGACLIVNSMSPYFLRALDLYSKKYSVSDVCQYWQFSYSRLPPENASKDLEIMWKTFDLPKLTERI